MAITNLSLGEHWETFIKDEIAIGRYNFASGVIRAALRTMEERKTKLAALRTHLPVGAQQAASEDSVDNFSIDSFIADLNHNK